MILVSMESPKPQNYGKVINKSTVKIDQATAANV